MKTPNIFDFATSELSQDAVLAYMLKWASRDYAKRNPAMHKLGDSFLRTLLKKTRDGLPQRLRFKKVSVKTQQKTNSDPDDNKKGIVDVQVEVNGEICLLIEDKTQTDRHSGQIKRYFRNAKTKCRDVRPIYLKTGNESAQTRLLTERICWKRGGGFFYREDMLKFLRKHTKTGNSFINDFRKHLQKLEDSTESFRSTPLKKGWEGPPHQGYYLALENRKGLEWKEWHNVHYSGRSANLRGRSHTFKRNSCVLYLQIQDSKDLFIRCRVAGRRRAVSRDLRNQLISKIQSCRPESFGIRVKSVKPKPGKTANIVKILFRYSDDYTYMSLDKNGKVKLQGTVTRLKKAAALLKAVCK